MGHEGRRVVCLRVLRYGAKGYEGGVEEEGRLYYSRCRGQDDWRGRPIHSVLVEETYIPTQGYYDSGGVCVIASKASHRYDAARCQLLLFIEIRESCVLRC